MTAAVPNLFVGLLETRFDREAKEREAVRDEIARNGTWWAASEIWILRFKVAQLQARLAAAELRQ